MTTRLLPLALFLFSCLPAQASTVEADWEMVEQAQARDEVSTWTRKVEGYTLKAFKGQTEVPYSMLTVLAVIADVERFPEWVFQCDDARLLPEIAYNAAWVHIKGIWPVSARDVTTKTEVTQDANNKTIVLSTRAHPDLLPETDGAVRIPALRNTFTLEPLDDGWTRITFDTFVDPGGYIPGWLANLVAIRAPRDSLLDMKVLMQEPKYHLTDAGQLPQAFPQWQQLDYPNRERAPALNTEKTSPQP